jgi:formylglycine-generating enzyme required for sulfatase activity
MITHLQKPLIIITIFAALTTACDSKLENGFERIVLIEGINCSNSKISGLLMAGSEVKGVSVAIPFTNTNGGNLRQYTITSSGVTGLLATLGTGFLSKGPGVLTFNISGTPLSSGKANFVIDFEGTNCSFQLIIAPPPGFISVLNCTSAIHSGLLYSGLQTNGVLSLVPYTGGNGGIYGSQMVNSTGVSGLTASLVEGTFSNGSGNLSYAITGTPSGVGTASFALNIGGRQCTLTRNVISGNNNAALVMKNIPSGSFIMGCTSGDLECDEREKPLRNVTLSAFQISETEITQAQYQAVMGRNPSRFGGCNTCPVEQVSWYDAIIFCNRLSEAQGLQPCYYSDVGYLQVFGKIGGNWALVNSGSVFWNQSAKGYRLPTEAEWEFASRGGVTSHIYSGGNNINDFAWFSSNSGSSTKPTKGKMSNAFGLYDMSGNVWEWCWDWYNVYPSSPQTNPAGPSSGVFRVLRGGGWGSFSVSCRVSSRANVDPSGLGVSNGFRVVR